jgi:hypothetical protein
MYKLLFSLLFEIKNSALKPFAALYDMEQQDFRDLILLVSQFGYIKGEIFTIDDCNITGATLTQLGEGFLIEHSYYLNEYPIKSEICKWVREDSVYTRRI